VTGTPVVDVERAVADTLERWRLSLVGRRGGAWPKIIVVDRRQSDRTTGCSRASPSTPRTAHSRVAIRSRSSSSCNVSATDGSSRAPSVASSRACGQCGAAEEEVDDRLVCRERHEPRRTLSRVRATNLKRCEQADDMAATSRHNSAKR